MLRSQRLAEALPTIAFVATNPGLPRLLTGRGPDAVGGAELQLGLLGRALARRGYSVRFGVGGYPDVTDCDTDEGISMRVLYAVRRNGSFARKLIRPAQLLAGLRRIPGDVYIIMGAGAQVGIVAGYCRATGKRSVFWLASDTDATCHVEGKSRTPKSERWLATRGLRWAHDVVAQTQHQASLVKAHHGKDATVIPNIWPFEIAMTEPDSDPYALWVSNIRPEKRPGMLLDIAAALPEVRFRMIGGPVRGHEGLYADVETRASQLRNVDFIGYVPFEETFEHFAGARLFVNTSAVEGFPNTYLQAWAAGKPTYPRYGATWRDQQRLGTERSPT